MKDSVFLLGGYDLEMQAIKTILIEKGFEEGKTLFDQKLSWGAKLSSYKNELETYHDKTIYGIELIEDITFPKNYKRIDHHNDLSDNEASIIQVLKLLETEPTREHTLIAANDVGHIEAMKCLGASKEETEDIRKRDRKAQGVSKEDEKQAEEDIKKVQQKNSLYLIETSLKNFSPIIDKFEKRPLLIYSNNALTFYGNILDLTEEYKDEIKNRKAYHGRGYFGFETKYVESQGIDVLLQKIIDMNSDVLYSYHNFMFPFRFDKVVKSFDDRHDFYKKHSFDDRVKLDESFKSDLENNKWRYEHFAVKNSLDYNELVYFHDFVKDSLFNKQEFKEGATSYFFKKEIAEDASFVLKILNKEAYALDLKGVTLRIFDTGVAILSFEVENRKYSDVQDILNINEYGRRVYPQFLGENFSTKVTKETFLPESTTVNGIEEHFCDLYKEIKIAKYITEILGDTFTTQQNVEDKYFIQPIIDDRMFVLSWYGNDSFSQCTKKDLMYDDWYKYIFVDGKDITVQDKDMQKKLIEKSSYTRWKGYGTFFGVTRYSFVSLSQNSAFTRDVLPLPHMKTIYFQMVILLLAQRASLLRFSDEITAISDVKDEQYILENISILYKNYLRFVNKLYFKEITAQDQGIELYDKAQDVLNITRDMEDLRQEIASLNEYASLEQEKKENEEMQKLTKLGTIFLPGTFIAGLLGMNVFPDNLINNWCMLIIAFLFIAIITYSLTKHHGIDTLEFLGIKSNKRRKNE